MNKYRKRVKEEGVLLYTPDSTETMEEKVRSVLPYLPSEFTGQDVVRALQLEKKLGILSDTSTLYLALYKFRTEGLIEHIGTTIRQKKRIVNLYILTPKGADIIEQKKIETLLKDITTYFLSDVADIVCC